MNEQLNMSVSSIIQKDGKKQIYVAFEDSDRRAEGQLPDAKITTNEGFSEEEIAALELYMKSNSDQIVEMAKQIHLADAFLK